MNAPLLEIEQLTVAFGASRVVDGVSFAIAPGEKFALVGESGSGKSITALSILRLVDAATSSGSIRFEGRELMRSSEREMRGVRGREIAMIFQEPMTALNPLYTVGNQIGEVLELHEGLSAAQARARAIELLARTGIPDAARTVDVHPHQLSGGQRQRAMIAMALACRPKLLIADEPTTALDVTIQAQILELLRELVVDTGTALVMITHDLGVVAGLCDRVHVMYAGKIIETADRHELFARPRQPYTGGLLASVPRLDAGRGAPLTPIRGSARDAIPWEQGCAFAPRCDNAQDDCLTEVSGSIVPLEYDGPGRELRCRHPLEHPPAPSGATALGAVR